MGAASPPPNPSLTPLILKTFFCLEWVSFYLKQHFENGHKAVEWMFGIVLSMRAENVYKFFAKARCISSVPYMWRGKYLFLISSLIFLLHTGNQTLYFIVA